MNKQILSASACTLALAAGPVAATTVIDTFDAPSQRLDIEVRYDNSTGSVEETSSDDPANIIGGYRNIEVSSTWTGSSTGGAGDTLVSVDRFASNNLNVSNDPNVQSTVTVTWDANGAGLDGVDLLDGTGDPSAYAFVLEVSGIDAVGVNISVEIEDLSGNTATGSETFTTPGQLYILYSDFTGSADFTKVDSIVMTMAGVEAAWDGIVDLVKSDPVATSVSGTLTLMALGLFGLARRGRAHL
jgi:hypothetical protein